MELKFSKIKIGAQFLHVELSPGAWRIITARRTAAFPSIAASG
jgi:hypothetical protein